ncbi:hypothetical protein LPJ53_001865 [Coemansia erecta]|uniref:Uncharacterized protein n=1 Tax=Coemansia erecta TaxID=147472 RepID=A0A9W7XZ68_9FUNG|nr:hypothetical protein LPJ53_001865 [Coemansia erecta]
MSFGKQGPSLPKDARIGTNMFSSEPLLMRMDFATYKYYRTLENAHDKMLMETASRFANVNVLTRPATKKELKKYSDFKDSEARRDLRLKYQTRQVQVLGQATFDMQWGLKWLLSYFILIEEPVVAASVRAERLPVITREWMNALASDGIHEVSDQLPELLAIIDMAQHELPLLHRLGEQLPGKFNTACSLLFAGQLRSAHIDMFKPKWVLADQRLSSNEGTDHTDIYSDEPELMTQAQARTYVSGIVPLDVTSTSCPADLRIVSIESSSADDMTAGHLHVTTHVYDRQNMSDKEGRDPVVLRMDQEMAPNLRVGFIIEATLHRLSNDIHYVDAVTMVWPSYTPLDHIGTF